MIYQPSAKKLVVQLIEDEEPKKGSLLLLVPEPKAFSRSFVIATNANSDFSLGDVVLHTRYTMIEIDKDKALYIIDISDVLCIQIDK
jgi:co-chaperonin GroES (HSP10)